MGQEQVANAMSRHNLDVRINRAAHERLVKLVKPCTLVYPMFETRNACTLHSPCSRRILAGRCNELLPAMFHVASPMLRPVFQ